MAGDATLTLACAGPAKALALAAFLAPAEAMVLDRQAVGRAQPGGIVRAQLCWGRFEEWSANVGTLVGVSGTFGL